jgi:hypothetical protein
MALAVLPSQERFIIFATGGRNFIICCDSERTVRPLRLRVSRGYYFGAKLTSG